MKRCIYCGRENADENQHCIYCGEVLGDGNENQQAGDGEHAYVKQELILHKEEPHDDSNVVRCPNCGSTNVQFVTKTRESDMDASNACCGFLLFGPIGLLCGLTGTRETKTVRKCMKCGHEF